MWEVLVHLFYSCLQRCIAEIILVSSDHKQIRNTYKINNILTFISINGYLSLTDILSIHLPLIL